MKNIICLKMEKFWAINDIKSISIGFAYILFLFIGFLSARIYHRNNIKY